VAIGRALMNDPDLILADEPTASLDSTRGRQVVTLLADEIHERGKAGILVTHDERLIDLCDRVLHMTDGRLARDEAAIAVGAA
jgi:putative ABC transport system ATP-binding protein